MNIKYFHEFKTFNDELCRFEILSENGNVQTEVTATSVPFQLEYGETEKLEPIKAAGATLNLISMSPFQFIDLHTDKMQEYMVKFYVNGSLYWLGWLDSETYSEDFSEYDRYSVQFTASDFNITERLKYLDGNGAKYTDVVSLRTVLDRCLNRLGLPFESININCSTTPGLEDTYIQSSNFYDEKGEAMTIREVLEGILKPFALMMVQKHGKLYIYDYNSIHNDNTLADFEDLKDLGFASADSTLEFDTLYNNVEITSGLYADTSIINAPINDNDFIDLTTSSATSTVRTELYNKAEGWERNGSFYFTKFVNLDNNQVIGGVRNVYDNSFQPDERQCIYKATPAKNILLPTTKAGYCLNVKLQAYVNTRDDIFNGQGAKKANNSQMTIVYCNLYLTDSNGNITYYYVNNELFGGWMPAPLKQGRFSLLFISNASLGSSNVLDTWLTNSNITVPFVGFSGGYSERVRTADVGNGCLIPIPSLLGGISGTLHFEICNEVEICEPGLSNGGHPQQQYSTDKVKDILYKGLEINLVDSENNEVNTDDFVFKTFINKNVASDLDSINLICISANEEQIPFGKANILDSNGKILNEYTREGTTTILEKLLMRTIHSNYSQKSYKLKVDVLNDKNLMLSKLTFKDVLGDRTFTVSGSLTDFASSKQELILVETTKDNVDVANIPITED